jgi:hypothetical protein|tara:strand:+ start:10704 stop:11102 length:399 start_codon:yes stop_codon:yes gene_type:complete
MNNIPEEYMNADFGFSALDEIPQEERTYEPPAPSEDLEGMKDNIERIEHDIRTVLEAVNGLSSKMSNLDDEFDVVKTTTEQEVRGKLIQVEKMVMPLLVNLLKTSDREYIHWPNREKTVQAQIDKLLAITRG